MAQTFDERTNERVIVIEYRARRDGDGVVTKNRKQKRISNWKLKSHLIGEGSWRQVLIFTRSGHGANRVARQLTLDGPNAAAIHGN